MTDTHAIRKKLIAEFTENYMEKLFYFCLKKTGNSHHAEDLTQDISINILTALSRGTIPERFSAWVWQIARNRYSTWADQKHRRSESVPGSDISTYEIEDERSNVLDEMLHSEELSLLRRELAFISSDYRNIIVAYHIEDRSVRDIAKTLGLPEGTVTSKLFRARKILKEGMSMAREFGVKSYKPEEITFTNNGSAFGEKGQPWNVLSHSLYKNIFLEVYGNPETAEELSLELGVALPYMEDELNYLTKETFLIKNGNKYETAFPIISKEAQNQIRQNNAVIAEEATHLLKKLIDTFTAACKAHGFDYYGGYQSYEDAKWTLLMCAFDHLRANAVQRAPFSYTERPDNGRWDIVGYQDTGIPALPWVGLHGHHDPSVRFGQFKYLHKNIQENTPDYLSTEESLALKMTAEGNWKDCDAKIISRLLDYGYIRKSESGYEAAIVVFDEDGINQCVANFTDAEKAEIAEIAEKIKALLADERNFSRKSIVKDLPPVFKNDERMCNLACSCGGFDRCDVLEQAVKDGWIRYDENTSKVIGAYLYI